MAELLELLDVDGLVELLVVLDAALLGYAAEQGSNSRGVIHLHCTRLVLEISRVSFSQSISDFVAACGAALDAGLLSTMCQVFVLPDETLNLGAVVTSRDVQMCTLET